MEEKKVKIGEKYKCMASPRYTCFKIGDTYEIKDEFEAALISLCRDCFTLDEESKDENLKRELTRFLINFNNGYYSRPSETEIDSWIKWIDKKSLVNTTTKFKVGDWVTDGNNVLKIKCLGNEFYCFESTTGYIDDIPISELDSKYHIWTIKDAKNCDILTVVNDERPFIFKGLLDSFHPRNPVAYCGIAKKYGFIISNTNSWWTEEEVEPATKKISDSLFQRIHEEGYEWDAESKKLIEIEQPSTNWSEKDENMCESVIDVFVNNTMSGSKGSEVYSEEIDWLKSIKDKVKPQTKQEWSKEDDYVYNQILKRVANDKKLYEHDLEYIYKWFKSIKDRVQPQSKQEWSEDDLWMLNVCCNAIDSYKEPVDKYLVKNWLKSLKPNNWKPSEEQINEVKNAIGVTGTNGIVLLSLYNDLKKL